MSESGAELIAAAKRLAAGGASARLWIDEVRRSAVGVANEAHGLTSGARRAENLARKLQGAAGRRNCVGVFGPSQAGKSYLVSALARRPTTPLTADFAGQHKDFLTEINPPGDRESTGLVTRFTAHKDPVDPAHPVELRLLSETDLVKILANSFYSDFDPNNMTFKLPDEAAIREALVAAEAAAEGQPAATHLDEITLFDLGEYFQRNFSARIEALDRVGFWDGLIATAGRLPLEQRARLYAMLWGGIEAFTHLFVDLARALAQLDFAHEARAELNALVPRDASIIDVAILSQLGSPADKADTISVLPLANGAQGAAVAMPRALLTALVAEIKIVMTERPWPFFAHTDLLDFPGARSRLKLTHLPDDAQERSAQVRELLLRGKIAYLFQRFTEERELTAMLLCMPPSVAEVKDLAGMVKSWIDLTHGASPKQRAQVSNALFLVLTKFDLEFLEKGGETADSRKGKWDRRLHASLIELYGKDEWVGNWDGRPFANALFLRNPGMKQQHLMDYAEITKQADGSERLVERGPAAVSGALIAEYQRAFIGSELVQRHFALPEETWAAAFEPNDGGVGFLVRRLSEVLDPDLKQRQVGERLREQARELEDSLRRFYHADDDASRREKEQALTDLRRQLFAAVRGRKFQSFAHLMDCLLVRERDARELFLNVAALRVAEPPPSSPAADESDPWADDPWAASPEAAASAPPPPSVDRPALFAMQVMNHWTEGVRRLSQNTQKTQALAIDARLIDDLVQEMIVGAHRLAITDAIARGVRAHVQSANVRWDDVADRAGCIAAAVINDYVSYLGFGDMPADKRPGFPEPPKEATRAIFAAPPAASGNGTPTLGPARLPLEQALFLDWGVALRQLGLDNTSFAGGREIDEAHNRQLGEILETIAIAPLVNRAVAAQR
ncbi:MAG: virulence factor [Rhodospirillales bacterium]|nr:virulence factor [Rhodospirillales bacterium]